MNVIRFLLIALTALTLAISGEALAKKTKDNPKKEHKISQSREINANKQSKTEENVRGQERAGERHDLKQSRENVNSNKQSKSEENVRGQERAEERHELKQNNGRGHGTSTRGPRQPRN